MQSLDDLLDLSTDWGGSLLRLYTIEAQDQRLQQKLEEQLCLRRDALTKLFADAAISDVAFTGADPFVHEGADVTVILRVKQPALFEQAAGRLAGRRPQGPQPTSSRPSSTTAGTRCRRGTRPIAASARSSSGTTTT